MVTTELTKSQFIVEVLNRDIQNIYKAELLIAQENIRLQGKELKQKKRAGKKNGVRSGELLNSLQNPQFNIVGIDGKFQVQANIPLQLRFLDMKHLGNWQIYNRQVWGILYNNSLRDIKYGYGRQIHNIVGQALNEAFKKTH